MNERLWFFGLLLLLCLPMGACTEDASGPESRQAAAGNVATGPVSDADFEPYENTESVVFGYGIYFLPAASIDIRTYLRKSIQARFPEVTQVQELSEHPAGVEVMFLDIDDLPQTYPAPDAEELRYFGRGLTSTQIEKVQDSEQALVLVFQYPPGRIVEGLRAANAMTEAVAREADGLIWDEITRQLFTPEAWRSSRLEPELNTAVPDVSKHITIHAYPSGDYVRAITLGMSKFGLPDLVVEDFSWSNQRSVGNLINAAAQVLAEGQPFAVGGRFMLDLDTIRHDGVRSTKTESLLEGGQGVAELDLAEGIWEEGDPSNQIVEIGFDSYPGPDTQSRQDKLLASFFGSVDEVQVVQHDQAIKTASDAARSELPGLRDEFAAGLEPGEYIMLKAPFAVPGGGREWMWVEVVRWKGDTIEGVLKNEPFNIPSLHAGQMLTLDQADIFDYIRHYPDGRQEGNQTGVLIDQSR